MTAQTANASALISVIIPALNEEQAIGNTLDAVACLEGPLEVIVVDGGSVDRTAQLAGKRGAKVIRSERGRGLQMHAGACVARGEILWFLHADTSPPPGSLSLISAALAADETTVGGNFEISFDGERRAARFLTWLYPQLRKLGLSYGDSAVFVRASVYKQVGGFQPFPIFEDLDLMRRLKTKGSIKHLPAAVVTSSRRFEGRSFTLTFARWAILQCLYWLGVHPRRIAKLYAPIRGAKVKS